MRDATSNHAAPEGVAHQSLDSLLVGDLRQLLTEPSDVSTRCFLLVILQRLLTLERRRESPNWENSKAAAEMLDQSPHLDRRLAAAQFSGSSLYPLLRKLFDRILAGEDCGRVGDDIHSRLTAWTKQFETHQRDVDDLQHEAFSRDFGGES